MQTIAITHPYFFPEEENAIVDLLANRGYWRVHIRKPGASEHDLRNLLSRIPEQLRQRLSIHDTLHLASEYHLGGIHLNRHNGNVPQGWNGMISRSTHSITELSTLTVEDYAFLSPVFPSISKPGYAPACYFDLTASKPTVPVFALGGVTPDKFSEIEARGFSGAAMLGAAWHPVIPQSHFRLQFITHPTERFSVAEGAALALEGGCRWIQLRMKNAPEKELLSVGRKVAGMCRKYGATFIIDDHVELVEELNADGVHLGLNDMPIADARKILGPMKIIGATANTLTNVTNAINAGADYIGLGPFRFTHTKKNLSPVLGIDGYRNILLTLRSLPTRSLIPVVAIGGIADSDIDSLLATGIDGIALSSFILSAPDPASRTADIISIISRKQENQT